MNCDQQYDGQRSAKDQAEDSAVKRGDERLADDGDDDFQLAKLDFVIPGASPSQHRATLFSACCTDEC